MVMLYLYLMKKKKITKQDLTIGQLQEQLSISNLDTK